MKANFFCQHLTGDPSFSIEEWNAVALALDQANVSEKEQKSILFPDACTAQCFNCMAIVGHRQKLTREAIAARSIRLLSLMGLSKRRLHP